MKLKTKAPKKVKKGIELDLNNEDGVLGVLGKTDTKEIHLKYVTYKNDSTPKLDIRQYITTNKYTGYTNKGVGIDYEDLKTLREYIDLIIGVVESGQLEPIDLIKG